MLESSILIEDKDKAGSVFLALENRGIPVEGACGCSDGCHDAEICEWDPCPNEYIIVVPRQYYNIVIGLMKAYDDGELE